MPNNKTITPVCLACEKRLTPVFSNERVLVGDTSLIGQKTGIIRFGKTNDSIFCSDQCASNFAHLIVQNISAQENVLNFRKKRLIQLRECYHACVDRGFLKDANRFVIKYNDYLYNSKLKGFDKLDLHEIKQATNQ